MLAFAWPWSDAGHDQHRRYSVRLAASLCAGIGGHADTATIGNLHLAYRPLRPGRNGRSWQPVIMESGHVAVFHGYFDNAKVIAEELGLLSDDPPRLYASAVERWGDDADLRIVGEYCAVIAMPERDELRLSRSPIRAPPLWYFHDSDLAAVASVPRALFATGVEQALNEAHLADAALVNFADPEQTYFQDVSRVLTGSIVKLNRDQERKLKRYYDPMALPAVRLPCDHGYVARAKELLDEAVSACLAGFEKPAVSLSGGLDSPQVAVAALAALPQHKRLATYTFHPEDGYDGLTDQGMIGDERPFVRAFARMHPRIDAYFTDNAGYEHDYRWNHFFHLMGCAPSGFCNSYVSHGVFSNAAKQGCDIVLIADRANQTFSEAGSWATVEYFVKGRWRQLRMALAAMPARRKSFVWRFIAHSLLPLLPRPVWRLARRVALGEEQLLLDLLQPMSPAYRSSSGADERLRRSGTLIERYPPRSRRHVIRRLLINDDHEVAEIYQAFEQMYGIPQRDPTAYRPLFEFCLGLPTEMFFRDGEMRWLAKEMAKGIMPEDQRANRLNGRWDADWHLRIGRRRKEFLKELDRIDKDERFVGMFDIPRLRKSLEDWPEQTQTQKRDYFTRELAVPRALLVARFINYVEGRNQP